jgi:peroxiredoxin
MELSEARRLIMVSPAGIPAPGSAAPDMPLQTSDGTAVQLAQYWRERRTLLFFVRHLGCVFCREQLAGIRDRYADIQALDAQVVVIAPTDVGSTARFMHDMRLPFPVLSDLRRRSFVAYGLFEAPLSEIIEPMVLLRTVREWTRGNIALINPLGSAFTQLGGLFVVDTDGVVRWSHLVSPVFNYPLLDTYMAALGGDT